MASPDPIEKSTNRWLPFIGMLQFDLRGMVRSRVVQGWLIFTILVAFGAMMNAIEKSISAPDLLAKVFSGYILVWSTVIIIISAGAVSAESGVVADSILSRGITRHAYILSKYASRLITTVVICAVVLIPLSYFASVHLSGTIEARGIAIAFLYVMLHVTFLAVLGVTFSIWFDRAIVAIAVLWTICYFFGAICSTLDVTFLAPMRLVMKMVAALGNSPDTTHLRNVFLGFGIPSIVLCALGCLWFTRRDV